MTREEMMKLSLNNMYGMMVTQVEQNGKKIIRPTSFGSACTSYAREFTIVNGKANDYDVNKREFIYADTDSICCELKEY